MDAVVGYGLLGDYELAALFHDLATRRCTSDQEADERQRELDRVGAAMDARGVQLGDWDLRSYR